MKLTDNFTTIAINRNTWKKLTKLKKDPKDSYDIIICNLLKQLTEKKERDGVENDK
jgi:predicted CopG family antitoxin|tara:strand:- start:3747 stop:3914 length:168 start_codon:yes stop_codon:yes gene_type:complete